MRRILGIAMSAALWGCGVSSLAIGTGQDQSDAPPSLRSLLVTKYKVTKTAYTIAGTHVLEAGPVFVVQKGGLFGMPPTATGRCVAQFKAGDLQPPPRFCTGLNSQLGRFLEVGEKVFIIKLEVNAKKNFIQLDLMECDTCNGFQQVSSLKSMVNVEFPPKFLDTAEPGQVSQVIDQLLGPDAGGAAQQAAAPAPPPQAAPQAQPAQIQIGDTPEQVESIMGPPDTKAVAGPKVIYVYKSLKVSFVNGKVADIQ
jgi:hypothetical protein